MEIVLMLLLVCSAMTALVTEAIKMMIPYLKAKQTETTAKLRQTIPWFT